MTPRAAWLTTVTLAVSILTYTLAVPGSEIVLLMLPLVVAVRYFAYTRASPLAPQWAVALATFAAVVFAGYRVLKVGAEIDVLAEFVAILAVIKSMERWSARDDMQILIIAIFLILASAISSSTLIIGVMLIIFVPLLGYTAMRLQIEGAIRFGKKHRGRAGDSQSRKREDDSDPLFGTFAVALILVTGITIVAFVLLPRGIGSDTLGGFTRPDMGRATGFRNSVELGRGGLISNDETIVMEVEVLEVGSDISLGALGKVYHLRGNALAIYDSENGNWSSTLDNGAGNNVTTGQAGDRIDLEKTPTRADLRQVIHLTPSASDSGMLFSLWQPIRVNFSIFQEGEVYYDTNQRTVRLGASRTKLTTYEVFSRSRPNRTGTRQERQRDPFFSQNPVIRSLAESVLLDEGFDADPDDRPRHADADAAEAIQDWLSTTGGYTYTLDIKSSAPGKDPIEWFLTDAKTGHCEYFASAMVAMCRSVGIDARVITGYVMAEYDSEKESYIVRRSNAHAWVEAETRPGIWETFDPTPDVFNLHAPEESQHRFLRRFLDAIDGFWLTSVVSFDKNNQIKMFGLEDQTLHSISQNREIATEGKRILRVVLSLAIAGITGFFIYRWYRKPKRAKAKNQFVDLPSGALDARLKLLRYWKASGRERPDWIGLIAHAKGEHEVELASMLSSAAFGSTPWADRHTTRSKQILAELAETKAN